MALIKEIRRYDNNFREGIWSFKQELGLKILNNEPCAGSIAGVGVGVAARLLSFLGRHVAVMSFRCLGERSPRF